MKRRLINATVYMTPRQREMLRALSEQTRVPIAAYVREGIDMRLEKAERE